MPTRRQLALLAAGVGCVCLAWLALSGLTARPARGVEPSPARIPAARGQVCLDDKPSGPVAVTVVLDPETAAGQLVHASLAPVRTLSSVSWRWELSPGLVLLRGALAGSADPGAGVTTGADILLLPPGGGRSAEARLVTEASFPGADETGPTGPETTVQSTLLRWGEAELSGAPIVPATDADTGEARRVALVPAVQRPGR